MRLAGPMAAVLILTGAPAPAQSVHLSGETAVDDVLARDIMRTIRLVAESRENCATISSVETAVLGGYRPSDARYRVADEATYERWAVSLCGRTVPFLISYWPAPQGGMMFNVGHPAPVDMPGLNEGPATPEGDRPSPR